MQQDNLSTIQEPGKASHLLRVFCVLDPAPSFNTPKGGHTMTHSNIIPFNYHEKEIRIIQDESGNPWWVAADICDALDLSNPTETLKSLDDDEKNTLRISEGIKKGNPNVNIINEPGLYTLIIRSNKPEAKKFKRWITHDVLPSIHP